MKEFLNLQQQLQNYLLGEPSSVGEFIVPTKDVSKEERLGIYKTAYSLRLRESLSTSFPALYLYLGTEEFNKLGDLYIKKYPSSFRSIRWFGDKLALLTRDHYAENYSFLAELADFEWKMTLAFDAKDQERMQITDMAAIAPESWGSLSFKFHPSVLRMNYSWNTPSLWQALVQEEDTPLPQMLKEKQTLAWIVWRNADYIINFQSLVEEEAWALELLIAGATFEELCTGLCQWFPPEEVALKAASYLKHWILKGLIIK